MLLSFSLFFFWKKNLIKTTSTKRNGYTKVSVTLLCFTLVLSTLFQSMSKVAQGGKYEITTCTIIFQKPLINVKKPQ